MKTVFLRVVDAEDEAATLLAAIRAPDAARPKRRFEVDSATFTRFPQSMFAYWVSERWGELFGELPLFEAAGRTAKRGLALADQARFVRCWWEVSSRAPQARWFPLSKGEVFSRYYSDMSFVVGYSREDQVELMATNRYGRSVDHFFRPGIAWPLVTRLGVAMRVMPAGSIFGYDSSAAFVTNDDGESLLALLAVTNSTSFRTLVNLQVTSNLVDVGVIQRTPVPELSSGDQSRLAALARRAWLLKRSLDTRVETSHAFTLPALLQVDGTDLAKRSAAWTKRVSTIRAELAAIQAEIDLDCRDLYRAVEADYPSDTESFGRDRGADSADSEASREPEDPASTARRLTAELVSWAVGVAFGRFDVRHATGERDLPADPEPFDALPARSPAMLVGAAGQPLTSAPIRYPLALPVGGVLVDDPGQPDDLTAAVRAVFQVVFGDAAHARWEEAAALLDPRGQDLRNWLARGFFEHHIQRYSRSFRRAPIFWQLGTRSSRYTVWLYAHRMSRDSLFQVQSDLVAPRLAREEGQRAHLREAAGPRPTSAQRKELAAQEVFVEELRMMHEEFGRVAALWQPDLDDGIVLTTAPLWRLVPQHKTWQRELKTAWDALATGKYDWARIAMHFWPERVLARCQVDLSIAIAHGREDVFWGKSILKALTLDEVGPVPQMVLKFARRLNVLTGDNGLGKSFLLDVAWWALTRTWAGNSALPRPEAKEPVIGYIVEGRTGTAESVTSNYDFDTQIWRLPAKRPPVPGLVLYARLDGSFSVWDPARSHARSGSTTNDREPDRATAFHFDDRSVWQGLTLGERRPCEGLIRDWVSWQRGKAREFDLLMKVIEVLCLPEEPLLPDEPVRVSVDDGYDVPTVRTRYGTVPLTHASAGVRRIVGLAYMLVWAWREHRLASSLLKRDPERHVVLLVDEPETHLHPKWQRLIVPALLGAVAALTESAAVDPQVIIATHSPLVLASLEPHFDPAKDSLVDLELVTDRDDTTSVVVRYLTWRRRGDVNAWLTSEVFDLKESRSIEAESAITQALAVLRQDAPAKSEIVRIDLLLQGALGDVDRFWVRWSSWKRDKMGAE